METILNHAFLLSSYLRTKFKLQANSLSGRQLRIRVIFERNYVAPFFFQRKRKGIAINNRDNDGRKRKRNSVCHVS